MRLTLALIILLVQQVNAQVLIVDPHLENYFSFNSSYINSLEIDTIVVSNHIKKRNNPMEETPEAEVIIFDEDGLFKEVIKVSQYDFGSDTNSVSFKYFPGEIMKSDIGSDGIIDYLLISKIENGLLKSEEKVVFDSNGEEEGRMVLRTLEYNFVNDSLCYITVLNSLGKPYRKITRLYDSSGNYLLVETVRNVIGGKKEVRTFTYNEQGYLIRVSTGKDEALSFEYNDFNELISIKFRKNNVEEYTKEFVYSSNGSLSAELLKYTDSPTVFIKKFEY